MSRSWLQKKRKGELIDLAQTAKIPDADGYLKDDLVDLLAQHLNSNETTYAKHINFRDYYGRASSPLKPERSSPPEAVPPTTTTTTTTRTRRRTLVQASPEKPTVEKSLIAPTPEKSVLLRSAEASPVVPTPEKSAVTVRTPRAIPRRVSEIINQVDIPASPAQLAEVADQSLQAVHTKATELWERTRIDQVKETIRENVSSVAAIQTLILLIEATGLQWNTLQMTPAIPVPEAAAQYTNNAYVSIPDGWALLTSDWWAPATLWSLTSWVLPLIVSYFVNLTLRSNTNRKSSDRQYPADPLTFNIVKALLAYSAFRLPVIDASMVGQTGMVRANDLSWGPFAEQTVSVVRNNVPGGYQGLQIGAVVGILISLYDAALKG